MNTVTEAVKAAIGLAPVRTPIRDKRRFLKVKIKSLAAEARIIRLEETRAIGTLREELHNHRVLDVRSECRATHIAYAYIRGRRFDQVEQLPRDVHPFWWYRQKPVFCRALRMILKYGDTEGLTQEQITGEFIDWLLTGEKIPQMPWTNLELK